MLTIIYLQLTLSVEFWKEIHWHHCLFIICLDCIQLMSIDLVNENDFTLKMARSRWYSTETITDVDYTDELINDVLLWNPTHGHTSVGWPAKTYIHQFYLDARCRLEDLQSKMANRDRWQEGIMRIHAISMTWW